MPQKKLLDALGQFSLSRGGEGFLNESRFALLEKIAETGSITHAAKAVGISYRTAWLTVDHLNALDDGPLVSRTTGGKSGGGTRLTDKGLELLKMYRILREEHGKYLERLRTGIHDFERFLSLTRKISLKTSARNQLFGKVLSIKKDALTTMVVLGLKGKEKIVSRITTVGLESLGFSVGDEAYALIKANWIDVTPFEAKKKGKQDNDLKGEILEIREGDGNFEYSLQLEGGSVLVAAAQKNAGPSGLKTGDRVHAGFNASNIIIGVPW
ncbi:MAG: molybdenum-dependent transcriptional regulator [Fibrobacteres bacterium]|nr:molybdenum-dependent transcriptional regulator [Fibrobacterota bacterium]